MSRRSKSKGKRRNPHFRVFCEGQTEEAYIAYLRSQNFLFYDADIPRILEKLKSIKSAKLLVSNPSIELWFRLHYKNHTSKTTTKDCIRELSNRNRNKYKKGLIDVNLENKLSENCHKACKRAKNMALFSNPSTNVYLFIEKLEIQYYQ